MRRRSAPSYTCRSTTPTLPTRRGKTVVSTCSPNHTPSPSAAPSRSKIPTAACSTRWRRPDAQNGLVLAGHKEFVPSWIGVAVDPLGTYPWAGQRGADDPFVENADQARIEVVRDRHPEALFDLFRLHGHVFTQRRETTHEVDVRFAVAVAMPVAEAD